MRPGNDVKYDSRVKDTATVLILTLLIMAILTTLNMGDIPYNDVTYN